VHRRYGSRVSSATRGIRETTSLADHRARTYRLGARGRGRSWLRSRLVRHRHQSISGRPEQQPMPAPRRLAAARLDERPSSTFSAADGSVRRYDPYAEPGHARSNEARGLTVRRLEVRGDELIRRQRERPVSAWPQHQQDGETEQDKTADCYPACHADAAPCERLATKEGRCDGGSSDQRSSSCPQLHYGPLLILQSPPGLTIGKRIASPSCPSRSRAHRPILRPDGDGTLTIHPVMPQTGAARARGCRAGLRRRSPRSRWSAKRRAHAPVA
jgi:hypothetical protein